ncbi:MAG TPA: rhodanese-like domain-containing protein [Candidatus Thermoplasmatota archaeon]|nr:rhodanese-like domain-containing protein [Candidatus Thermoplasmatota archaeon]
MVEFVDADEVEEAMGDREARILNVLPRAKYDQRHIPFSINIPLDDPDFESLVRQVCHRQDQRIIVHCSSLACDASTRAALRIEAMGYTHVLEFKAGIAGWAAANRRFEAGQATRRGDFPPRGPRPASQARAGASPAGEASRPGGASRKPRP